MIHHASIPARDPVRVARVLAELMGGKDYPFTGPLRTARMAVSGDPHGTMIEVYPDTVSLVPGTGEGPTAFVDGTAGPEFLPFHILLSVPLDRPAIEAIGEREGWRTRFFSRGPAGKPAVFHLVELWVENRVLIELVPREYAGVYERFMQIERIDALTG